MAALALMLTLSACGGPQERKAQYRSKAQDYIQAGNFPKARVALRNVLKIDPKDADAYFLVAQVEEKEKNWRNAVANYQQVIDIVPDHKEALIILAKYYLEAKLVDEVGRAADKVLAKHPQDPQAQALKIALLAQQDKMDQARVRAEELSKRYPTEPDVAILLATLYGHMRRSQDARSDVASCASGTSASSGSLAQSENHPRRSPRRQRPRNRCYARSFRKNPRYMTIG
jgi:tetratricopeptide (TPR) repeat protein